MLLMYLLYSVMVLPFSDYCDIIWDDRNTKVLMDSLQVLHNNAAKIVLNRPVHSSSTQALIDLRWIQESSGSTARSSACPYFYMH